MKSLKQTLALSVLILLAGCTLEEKPSEATGLALASHWALSSMGNGSSQVHQQASRITISPDLTAYKGNGGCNSIRGKLEVKGDKITFGMAMMTKMACSRMQQETAFMQGLHQANKYKIANGKLYLYAGNQLVMTLEKLIK